VCGSYKTVAIELRSEALKVMFVTTSRIGAEAFKIWY
jgi:hypothetical protein